MALFSKKKRTDEELEALKIEKKKRKEQKKVRKLGRRASVRRFFHIKRKVSRSGAGTFGIFIFVAILAGFMLIPFIYAISQSLKPLDEIFIFPPRIFPINPTFNNFILMFNLTSTTWVPFTRYLFNSIFISATATFLHVIFSSLAAYPIAKHTFPGQKFVRAMITVSLLFTAAVTGIPRYIILANAGFINTYWAFIIPAIPGTLGLFLMMNAMNPTAVPMPLIEGARIDGASELKIYWNIVMPNVKPAWLTLIIFAFQGIWGETAGAYIYDERLKTLPTMLGQIAAAGISRVGVGAAVTVFLMIPPLLIFILSQSSVIETMSSSGIK